MERLAELARSQSLTAIVALAVVLVAVAALRRFVLRRPLDLFAMWGHTRMVVYAGVTGALYFAMLVPFKFAVVVPGFSEVRPGVALPLALSFLFGPAAAWGAGIGNLIGDFFGTFGPGSVPGFLGNFLLAYAPYSVCRALLGSTPPHQAGWKGPAAVAFSIMVGVFACSTTIAWGCHLMGLAPFRILAPVILINNTLVGLALALPLTLAILPRAIRWNVVYHEVMDAGEVKPAATARLGAALFSAAALSGWVIGMALSATGNDSALGIGLGVAPSILGMLIGVLLL